MPDAHNLYRQLLALLPSDQLQVGQVLAWQAGIATVQLPGGGQMRARGQASVGDQVFIKGERIEGPAPSLPTVTGEV